MLTFLLVPPSATAAHWLAYYPGGIVNWYFGDYPFFRGWPNIYWPAWDSYFTYGIGQGTYKIYYPNPDPMGKFYYLTPKAGLLMQETTALIEVKVPVSDADVWFEGWRTSRSGLTRQFLSPPLVIGRDYRYEILALWHEGRQEIKHLRHVTLRAGDRISIDFSSGPPGEITEPRRPGL
jgi:uncharacterized protein (TIGR03000 family)